MTCRVVEIHTAIIQNWRFSRQGAEILKMLPWKSNNGFPHYCWSDTNYCALCIIELIPTQLSEQRNTIHRQYVAVNNILKNLPCKRNSYFSVYCSATMTLYRNNAAGNNKMYWGSHWKCLIFLFDFNQISIFLAGFKTGFQYQISRNAFKLDMSWYMRRDGRTHVTKLIFTFCGYGRALKLTPQTQFLQ